MAARALAAPSLACAATGVNVVKDGGFQDRTLSAWGNISSDFIRKPGYKSTQAFGQTATLNKTSNPRLDFPAAQQNVTICTNQYYKLSFDYFNNRSAADVDGAITYFFAGLNDNSFKLYLPNYQPTWKSFTSYMVPGLLPANSALSLFNNYGSDSLLYPPKNVSVGYDNVVLQSVPTPKVNASSPEYLLPPLATDPPSGPTSYRGKGFTKPGKLYILTFSYKVSAAAGSRASLSVGISGTRDYKIEFPGPVSKSATVQIPFVADSKNLVVGYSGGVLCRSAIPTIPCTPRGSVSAEGFSVREAIV